jgi:hypothetical protein
MHSPSTETASATVSEASAIRGPRWSTVGVLSAHRQIRMRVTDQPTGWTGVASPPTSRGIAPGQAPCRTTVGLGAASTLRALSRCPALARSISSARSERSWNRTPLLRERFRGDAARTGVGAPRWSWRQRRQHVLCDLVALKVQTHGQWSGVIGRVRPERPSWRAGVFLLGSPATKSPRPPSIGTVTSSRARCQLVMIVNTVSAMSKGSQAPWVTLVRSATITLSSAAPTPIATARTFRVFQRHR